MSTPRTSAGIPGWISCGSPDPFVDGARELAGRYGGRATESGAEVFADSTLNAVVICSPTDTHVGLIRTAVEHKLAVLCEKPVDLDLERARQCLDELARPTSGARPEVMLGFNRRFDPAFAARTVTDAVAHFGNWTAPSTRQA